MNKEKRIPKWTNTSLYGVGEWFKAMLQADLLYHPDDDPKDIISVQTGQRIFNRFEVKNLRKLIQSMFSMHGVAVYEAALPAFREVLRIRRNNRIRKA